MIASSMHFLIVDDDKTNNFLTTMAIKKSFGPVEILEFVVPELALEYIETEFNNQVQDKKTILFLDINMPTLNAWEFLEKFDGFVPAVKKQFDIYILSSSIDLADIQRAKLNPLVIDFIEKPLNKATLATMLA